MYDSIISFYRFLQPLYDKIRKLVPTIEFTQGVNSDLMNQLVDEITTKKKIKMKRFSIFDDFIREVSIFNELTKIVTARRFIKFSCDLYEIHIV